LTKGERNVQRNEMKSTLRKEKYTKGEKNVQNDESNWNHTLRGRDMTKERDQNF
jgi:hypothetical protein